MAWDGSFDPCPNDAGSRGECAGQTGVRPNKKPWRTGPRECEYCTVVGLPCDRGPRLAGETGRPGIRNPILAPDRRLAY